MEAKFRKEYIWGLTQGNPMHHSKDQGAFHQLIRPLTGDNAAITIGASFHPYQLKDESDDDVWENVLAIVRSNNSCDLDDLVNTKSFFHMNPPGAEAFPIRKWDDKRLFHEINPEFSKYVPFVIPYLVHDDGHQPQWLMKLYEGMTGAGNAHEFIREVNTNSRFIMPEPSFIIGFEEFHTHNPVKMINHFVDFLQMHIKNK